MRKINIDELKGLQLQILNEVDKFCNNNNIKYSLAFGTLLGAVRHKGYIPWDDDIDIMMPRDDYEIFMGTFVHSRYKAITFQKNQEYVIPYGKVIDDSTILIEDSRMSLPIGVNIDVFPIDACPPSREEKQWFIKKQLIDAIYTLRKLNLEKDRSIIKNAIILINRLITCPFSLAMLCKYIQQEAIKYNKTQNPGKKGILSTGDTKFKWMIPSTVFETYTTILFENLKVQCIKEYHSYLSATYGNYMELPPEDKRIAHHYFRAFWK